MKNLIPYLVFPGTCKEAMEYYASIFEGEITNMTTFKDSPVPAPKEAQDRIFNSELKTKTITFKASDDMPGYEVKTGTNISLFLVFEDPEQKKNTFDKLSQGGKIQFPIEENFGMCTDKYGIQWMLVSE